MNNRVITTDLIEKTISDMVCQASFTLPLHVTDCFVQLKEKEETYLARETMGILLENAKISNDEKIPLCQDCGFTTVFIEIGQNVSLSGKPLYEAINDGVAKAYRDNKLRKSIVADPLRRENTGTNTPSFIHVDVVAGDKIKLTVYLKGGGSENMSQLKMFRPTDSVELIIDYIIESVVNAGPNPCPPLYLGIGIGGTADMAVLNAKKAVLREPGTLHEDPFYRKLEQTIFERLNLTNVGPLGFGGKGTVCGVYIKEAATHIASLPVALNMSCHSFRTRVGIL